MTVAVADAHIAITLPVAAGRIAAARVQPKRRVPPDTLLADRHPEQVVPLLAVLFPLCGTAQTLAGLAAVEQAAERSPASAHHAARDLLLTAETAAELAVALERDAPDPPDAPPPLAVMRRLRQAQSDLRRALYPGGDWARIGGGALRPDRDGIAAATTALDAAITDHLGAAPDAIVGDPAALADWAATAATAPARRVARVLTEGWAGFGAVPPRWLTPGDLEKRLAADHEDETGALPETGSLARRFGHPLVTALVAAHGPGLLARLGARLADLAMATATLAAAADGLVAADPGDAAPARHHGTGLGIVEAARGLLAHRVDLCDGRIRRYRVAAPTDWNFHPAGALARALEGAAAGSDPVARVRALAAAFDPCVTCTVTAERADA